MVVFVYKLQYNVTDEYRIGYISNFKFPADVMSCEMNSQNSLDLLKLNFNFNRVTKPPILSKH